MDVVQFSLGLYSILVRNFLHIVLAISYHMDIIKKWLKWLWKCEQSTCFWIIKLTFLKSSGQHEPINILYSTRHDVSYIYGKNNEWKDNVGCPDPL
jgi:hypothetical protein